MFAIFTNFWSLLAAFGLLWSLCHFCPASPKRSYLLSNPQANRPYLKMNTMHIPGHPHREKRHGIPTRKGAGRGMPWPPPRPGARWTAKRSQRAASAGGGATPTPTPTHRGGVPPPTPSSGLLAVSSHPARLGGDTRGGWAGQHVGVQHEAVGGRVDDEEADGVPGQGGLAEEVAALPQPERHRRPVDAERARPMGEGGGQLFASRHQLGLFRSHQPARNLPAAVCHPWLRRSNWQPCTTLAETDMHGRPFVVGAQIECKWFFPSPSTQWQIFTEWSQHPVCVVSCSRVRLHRRRRVQTHATRLSNTHTHT